MTGGASGEREEGKSDRKKEIRTGRAERKGRAPRIGKNEEEEIGRARRVGESWNKS